MTYTLKYFAPGGRIEIYAADRFSYSPSKSDQYRGSIDTHDGRDDIVLAHGSRLYVVNSDGQTVFASTDRSVG